MTEHPPELVELVVNLIDDHRPVFDEQGHISGTVPGRGAWECLCGISGTYDEVVLHAARAILDALKAGGYAVVKLPEPSKENTALVEHPDAELIYPTEELP